MTCIIEIDGLEFDLPLEAIPRIGDSIIVMNGVPDLPRGYRMLVEGVDHAVQVAGMDEWGKIQWTQEVVIACVKHPDYIP